MQQTVRSDRSVLLRITSGLFAASILSLSLNTLANSDVPGEDLYEKRCALCHKLPDPAQVPPQGWEKELETMAPLARLKKKQKAEILQFLQDHAKEEIIEATVLGDRALVEEQCLEGRIGSQ